jgi:hypothetical protein
MLGSVLMTRMYVEDIERFWISYLVWVARSRSCLPRADLVVVM